MSTKNIVTYETVAAAAESLSKDDKRVSVRAVMGVLGGGSPNAILPLLNQWKAGRPVVQVSEIHVDPRIASIIGEQISKATAEARSDVEQRLSEVEADAAAIAEAGREAEQALEAAQAEITKLTAQVQAQAGQIEQLRADSEQVKREAANQVAAAQASARDAITKAEDQAARERGERELAQVALAKAELRLEAMPKLQAEVEKLQTALDAERQAKAVSDAKAAALDAKATGLEGRLADCQAQADKAAKIADERLNEQNRSCSELVGTLKAEISGLQQRLVEALKPVEKPAA